MVTVNIDGSNNQDMPEKVYIQDDSYEAVIVDVSDAYIADNPYAKGDEPKQDEKVNIAFEVSADGKPATLMMYPKTKVTKGSGKYSNSKLFDVLDAAKLTEEFGKTWTLIEAMDKDKQAPAFVQFLRDNLIGKKCKVSTKTTNKDDKEKRYSTVKEVLRFL